MPEWILKNDKPTQLKLATDARLTPTSYTNDQIWEFVCQRGEPPGLSLETTLGLRARSFRIFPRFSLDGVSVNEPEQFASAVVVHEYYPNLLTLTFSPFKDIEVALTYWIPNSESVSGIVRIKNLAKKPRKIQVEWICILIPIEYGERMAASEFFGASALRGQSGGIEPVFFLAGGSQPSRGSFPSLSQEVELKHNQWGQVVAALANLGSGTDSFELARKIANKNFNEEAARIKMINANRIQVLTGNPDWNQIIELSQTIGNSLLMSPSSSLPNLSFVLSRQPDQGFSPRGDGTDYNYLWNGQSALHSWFLSEEVLPHEPAIGKGLVENFLSLQTENGFIDWKPGLANQRGKLNSTPMLASFTWSIYLRTGDLEFVRKAYPKLKKFIESWFDPENDLDSDGVPEWKHVFQTGFDDNLLFNSWREEAQGVDISTVESPDLCSMLYKECRALMKLAEVIGSENVEDLAKKARLLRTKVEDSWQDESACYHYMDRDNHNTLQSQILATRQQAGDFLIEQSFDNPIRLQIRLHRPHEGSRKINFFIHGASQLGDRRIERIPPEKFSWHIHDGFATSEKTFTQLDKIVVEGLLDGDQLTIQTVGLTQMDQTLLLPLWSGIPSKEHAECLIKNTLLNPDKFWHEHGVPSHLNLSHNAEVHIPYNTLILRGLIHYGFRKQAAELLTRLMNTFVAQINREGFFQKTYQSNNGFGIGEKNALEGLVPLGSFLKILGIEIISPWKVFVTDHNPFPWPVTVKYCGTTILRKIDMTTIIFPDGQSVNITDNESQMVSVE
jgi:hypothetical protein